MALLMHGRCRLSNPYVLVKATNLNDLSKTSSLDDLS